MCLFATRLAELELVPYDPSFLPSAGQALVDRLDEVAELARLHAQISADSALLDSDGDAHVPHLRVAALAHRVDGLSSDRDASVTAHRRSGCRGFSTTTRRSTLAWMAREQAATSSTTHRRSRVT